MPETRRLTQGSPKAHERAPTGTDISSALRDVQSSCRLLWSAVVWGGPWSWSQQFLGLCHCLCLPALELITQTHVGHKTPSRGLDPALLREPQAQVLGEAGSGRGPNPWAGLFVQAHPSQATWFTEVDIKDLAGVVRVE